MSLELLGGASFVTKFVAQMCGGIWIMTQLLGGASFVIGSESGCLNAEGYYEVVPGRGKPRD